MGDFNAIYEAGQSLVELFKAGMTPQPIANEEAIGLCIPHEPEDFQLTVWIYNIERVNETGMNQGYAPDPLNREKERYVPLQLKLNALVSAHSKAPAQTRLADEYKIIGRAMQIIYDTPIIPPTMLIGSLARTGVPMQVQYLNINNDELTKIWNNGNKIIKPSFSVQISAVTIESNRIRPVGPRVTSTDLRLKKKNG